MTISLISTWAIIKNPEMWEFVPDYLKTKKMCEHAVKKLPFVIRYVPIDIRLNKVVQENGGTLQSVPDSHKNQQMCEKAVVNNHHALNLSFIDIRLKNVW